MRQTQPTKEYRWLAAFTLFFLGSAMLFSFALFPVLFRSIETRESLNLAKRALSYTRTTMDNLYARTLDIVNWDESYHFMLERQAGFIEKNFTPTFFKALDIDTVLFLKPDGSVYYGTSYDFSENKFKAFDEELATFFVSYPALLNRAIQNREAGGILPLQNGAFSFSVSPIHNSFRMGDSTGFMLFGRRLARVQSAYLESVFHVDSESYDLVLHEQNPQVQKLLEAVDRRSNVGVVEGRNNVRSLMLLTDLHNQPVFLTALVNDRHLSREGWKALGFFWGILAFSSLLTYLLGVWFLKKRLPLRAAKVPSNTEPVGNLPDMAGLQAKSQQLAAIYATDLAYIVFFNTFGQLVDCSQAVLRLFQAASVKELAERFMSYSFTLSRRVFAEHIEAVLKEGHGCFEWQCVTRWGEVLPLLVCSTRVDIGGDVSVCCVVQDLREVRSAEQSLLAAAEKVEKASQTQTEFLARMSHELRTPMNAITGFCYLALQTQLNTQQKNYIYQIEGACQNLLAMVNDVLDFSRMEHGESLLSPRLFDVYALLRSLEVSLALKAREKGLNLRFSKDAVPPFAVGDPRQLGNLVNKLVENAIKFTSQGSIDILLDVAEDKPECFCLHITVQDTGIGMDKAQVDSLFKPFAQGDTYETRSVGGAGLGLVICRHLVEQMGGRMWVESKVNQGSRFHVTVWLDKSPGGEKKGV